MAKNTVRNGCILLCGKLLPAMLVANGDIVTFPAVLNLGDGLRPASPAQALAGAGATSPPPAFEATGKWLCAGISVWIRVINWLPPCSPRNLSLKPEPCP